MGIRANTSSSILPSSSIQSTASEIMQVVSIPAERREREIVAPLPMLSSLKSELAVRRKQALSSTK